MVVLTLAQFVDDPLKYWRWPAAAAPIASQMRSNTAIRVTAEFADRLVLAMNLVYHKTCGVAGGREKRQYHPVWGRWWEPSRGRIRAGARFARSRFRSAPFA